MFKTELTPPLRAISAALVLSLAMSARGVELPSEYLALESVTIPAPRSGVVPAFKASDVKGYRFRFTTTDAAFQDFILFAVVKDWTNRGSYVNAKTLSGGFDQTGEMNDISGTVNWSGDDPVMFGAAWQDHNFGRTADWYEAVFTDASGSEIGHFWPCLRLADNAIGFYDTVSQAFYGKGDYEKWEDFTTKALVDVTVDGSPYGYGTVSPAYGSSKMMTGLSTEWLLTGLVTYPDGVTAYPRHDAPGRARTFAGATCSLGGTEETIEETSFVRAVAAGSVTWNFADAEDAVLATAETGGQVSVDGGASAAAITNFYALGSSGSVSVEAVPDDGFVFSHWSGDVTEEQSVQQTLTLERSRAYALTAHFVAFPAELRRVTYITIPKKRSGVLTDLTSMKSVTIAYACRETGSWICVSPFASVVSSTSPYLQHNDHTTDGSLTVRNLSFSYSGTKQLMFGAAWSDESYSRTADWYRARFYGEDREVIGDFFPCVRRADDVPGFYDAVSEKFYEKGDSSWGDFVSSSVPHPLTVEGDPAPFGTVTPAYGETMQTPGERISYALSGMVEYPDGVLAYPGCGSVARARTFLGADYAVDGSAVESISATSFSRVFPESDAAVTWRFGDVDLGFAVAVRGPGRVVMDLKRTIRTAETNYAPRSVRHILEAKPDAGARFVRWEGIDDPDLACSPRLRLESPVGVTAVFVQRHFSAPGYAELDGVRIAQTAGHPVNVVVLPILWKDVRKVVLKMSVVDARYGTIIFLAGAGSLANPAGADPWISAGNESEIKANNYADFVADPASFRFGEPVELTLTGWTGFGNYVMFGSAWTGYHFTGDWYEVAVYDADDAELAHLWPCRRKATGEVGFYDTVSQSFFGKAVEDATDFSAPTPIPFPLGFGILVR